MSRTEQHTHIDSLIAHAANGRLGETVDMQAVEATFHELSQDPMGLHQLRRTIPKVNDPEIIQTLEEWIDLICDKLKASADRADHGGEKIAAPFQTVSLGAMATLAVGGLTGLLSAPVLIPGVTCALIISSAATYARWKLAGRKSASEMRIEQMRRIQKALRP